MTAGEFGFWTCLAAAIILAFLAAPRVWKTRNRLMRRPGNPLRRRLKGRHDL